MQTGSSFLGKQSPPVTTSGGPGQNPVPPKNHLFGKGSGPNNLPGSDLFGKSQLTIG